MASDWPAWVGMLEDKATQLGVWKYVDPDGKDDDPGVPEQTKIPEKPNIIGLEPDRRLELAQQYSLDVSEYIIISSTRKDTIESLEGITSWIDATVHSDLIRRRHWKMSVAAMVKSLRTQLQIDSGTAAKWTKSPRTRLQIDSGIASSSLDVHMKWTSLMSTPLSKKTDVRQWCMRVQETFELMSEERVLAPNMAFGEFLMQVQEISESWVLSYRRKLLKTIERGQDCDFDGLVDKFVGEMSAAICSQKK